MIVMAPQLAQTLRRRWVLVLVHLGSWLLLYLALTALGGKAPDYRDAQAVSAPPQSPVPVAKLVDLFTPPSARQPAIDPDLLSDFVTRHFIPVPPPAPKPPTTRKVEVTYQGFYQTDGGTRIAVVKVGDAFAVVPLGARVTTNFMVAEATMQLLTLTNVAAQTNLLPLNVKKEIEVPLP